MLATESREATIAKEQNPRVKPAVPLYQVNLIYFQLA